jgi:hypothetical protein
VVPLFGWQHGGGESHFAWNGDARLGAVLWIARRTQHRLAVAWGALMSGSGCAETRGALALGRPESGGHEARGRWRVCTQSSGRLIVYTSRMD